MYSIYVDNRCIFDSLTDDETLKVISPRLTREDSCSGSLEFTLPPTNVGFEWINLMTSDIIVKCKQSPTQDPQPIWVGRATGCDVDFYKRKKYYCEGALSFLVDTLQPTSTFEGSISECLDKILEGHNSKAGQNRRILLGMVSDSSNLSITVETDYDTTLNTIISGILEKTEGHVDISVLSNGTPILNYYSDWLPAYGQTITFGENLLDMTQNFDVTDICTAIIPRATVSNDSGDDQIIDISSVNNGSNVLVNTELFNKYGYVERLVEFKDVETPAELLEAAQRYFSDTQFNEMSIDVSAFDLSYLNYKFYSGNSAFEPVTTATPFEVLHLVHCVSEPHGLDRDFPVTKIQLSLNDPSDMSITLNSDKSTYLTSNLGGTTVNINNTTNNITNGGGGSAASMSMSAPAGDSQLFLGGGPSAGSYQNDPWSVLGWIGNQYSPYPDLYAQRSNIQIVYNMPTNYGSSTVLLSAPLGSTIIIFANGWVSDPMKIPEKLVNNGTTTMPGDLDSITSVQIAIYSAFTYKSYSGSLYKDVGMIVWLYPFGTSGPMFGWDGTYPLAGNPTGATGPMFTPIHNMATGATDTTVYNVTSVSGGTYKTAIVCFHKGLESLAEFYASEVQNGSSQGYKTWTVVGASATPTVPITAIDRYSYAGGYRYGDGTLQYSMASGGVGITPWDVPYVGMHEKNSMVLEESEWKFAIGEDGLAGSADGKPKLLYPVQDGDDTSTKKGEFGYTSIRLYTYENDQSSSRYLYGLWTNPSQTTAQGCTGFSSNGTSVFAYVPTDDTIYSYKDLIFTAKENKIGSTNDTLDGYFRNLYVQNMEIEEVSQDTIICSNIISKSNILRIYASDGTLMSQIRKYT